jgi:hypothetical protein
MGIRKGSSSMSCWLNKSVVAIAVTVSMLAVTQAPVYGATLDAPAGLTAAAGNTQVVLTWTAVAGSPSATDYMVQYSVDGGVNWLTFAHNASTAATQTVTGLVNNTTYRFRVSTINSDGVSLPAGAVIATPKVTHTANDPAMFSACPTAAAPAGSTVAIAAAGFSDITSTKVDCIKYYGITKGTTATTYSPLDSVSRWQMALFLTRMANISGITLGDGSDQGFTDILGKSAEIQTAINQIKQLGITTGTTATTYDPDSMVTREQMALFIHRLLKKATVGPGGNTEYVSGSSGAKEIKSVDADHNFTDLTGITLAESITAVSSLWNLGVAVGTAGTLYEPQKAMNRSMMATFMANALDHTNARPAGFVLQASKYRTATEMLTFSITDRTADFSPVVGTPVDTFYFVYSTDTTVARFGTAGYCADTYATSSANLVCKVEATDPVTDSSGNVSFTHVPGAVVETDFYAWTAPVGTIYDNDVYANSLSKVTVVTTS